MGYVPPGARDKCKQCKKKFFLPSIWYDGATWEERIEFCSKNCLNLYKTFPQFPKETFLEKLKKWFLVDTTQ